MNEIAVEAFVAVVAAAGDDTDMTEQVEKLIDLGKNSTH